MYVYILRAPLTSLSLLRTSPFTSWDAAMDELLAELNNPWSGPRAIIRCSDLRSCYAVLDFRRIPSEAVRVATLLDVADAKLVPAIKARCFEIADARSTAIVFQYALILPGWITAEATVTRLDGPFTRGFRHVGL